MTDESNKNIKKVVLLVEDDVFIRDILYGEIIKGGIAADTADNGKSALEKLTSLKGNLSLILLDLVLPDKTGYEILEFISKDEDLKKVPVVVLSNLGQQEEIDKAKALGAVAYMIKAQSDTEDIVAKVKELLK